MVALRGVVLMNSVMLQTFEWYTRENQLYKTLLDLLAKYKSMGIQALWMPPPVRNKLTKSSYVPYDLYDLGEFDIHGNGQIHTQFGTKEELIQVTELAKQLGVLIYMDITFNHLLGADAAELVDVRSVDPNNRYNLGPIEQQKLFTRFDYLHRNRKHSSFQWRAEHFTGAEQNGIWQIGPWNWPVDDELGNYDFLIGTDINHAHPEVRGELMKWGRWLNDILNIDGYRIDASKHISFDFQKEWLYFMRQHTQKQQFCVSEYYSYDLSKISKFLEEQHWQMSAYDFPLQLRLREASKSKHYDLTNLFRDTLTQKHPMHSVTFIENHDTQCRGLGVFSSKCVEPWFKPMAYSFILLREDGYPCVFIGDLEGTSGDLMNGVPAMLPVAELPRLLEVRQLHNFGPQHTIEDDPNCIAWTREGNHRETGIAVLFTNKKAQIKRLFVGLEHTNQIWYEAFTGKVVAVDHEGFLDCYVSTEGLSVYTPQLFPALQRNTPCYEIRIFTEHMMEGQAMLHYRINASNEWQIVPMIPAQQYDGFVETTINLGNSLGIECFIKRGDGSYDVSYGNNHKLCAGTWTLASNRSRFSKNEMSYQVMEGNPFNIERLNEELDHLDDVARDTSIYTNEVPDHHEIELYFEQKSEGTATIHYRPYGNEFWESLLLTRIKQTEFCYGVIDLGVADGVECAIERSDGTYDVPPGQNHKLRAGTWTIWETGTINRSYPIIVDRESGGV